MQLKGLSRRLEGQQARRLLHDDTLPTEVRTAGLLIVLYAQTATSIRTLRFDQVQSVPDGARITFGTIRSTYR